MSQTTAPRPAEADTGVQEGAIFVDRRALAFKERGLCDALNALWKENSTGVRAAGAKFLTAQQQVVLTLNVGEQVERRTLGAAELAPLLIGYCIGARLPLPASAVKTVTVNPAGVLLDFMLVYTTMPPYRGMKTPSARVLGEWTR